MRVIHSYIFSKIIQSNSQPLKKKKSLNPRLQRELESIQVPARILFSGFNSAEKSHHVHVDHTQTIHTRTHTTIHHTIQFRIEVTVHNERN